MMGITGAAAPRSAPQPQQAQVEAAVVTDIEKQMDTPNDLPDEPVPLHTAVSIAAEMGPTGMAQTYKAGMGGLQQGDITELAVAKALVKELETRKSELAQQVCGALEVYSAMHTSCEEVGSTCIANSSSGTCGSQLFPCRLVAW